MALQTKAFFQGLATVVQQDWIDVFDSVVMQATAKSVDNHVARFNGTTGDIQNSGLVIDDADVLSGVAALGIAAGGYLQLGTWTTAARPAAPAAGMLGWNTTIGALDYYDGSAWNQSATTWVITGNDFLPTVDNTGSIGSAAKQVKNLFIGTQTIAVAGSAGAPSYSFSGDLNTGVYAVAADSVGVSAGGAVRLTVDTAAITGALPYLGSAGSAGAPSHSFSGDANTGLYSSAADAIGVSTGGTLRVTFATAGVTSTIPWLASDGTAGSPSMSFASDPNTGLYSVGADSVGISTGGTLRLTIANAAITAAFQVIVPDAVGLSFTTADVGIGRNASGVLEINSTSAGTLRDLTLRSLQYSGGIKVSTLRSAMAGTLTLTTTSAVYNFLDPNGSDRQVTLPTAAAGISFVFDHIGGANTITVKDAGASTVTTLTTGQIKTVIYDGMAWQVL